MKKTLIIAIATIYGLMACTNHAQKNDKDTATQDAVALPKLPLDTEKYLEHAATQVKKTLAAQRDTTQVPRNIPEGQKTWNTTKITNWTAGFFPGIAWYCFEATGDSLFRNEAIRWCKGIEPIKSKEFFDHDLGFELYCSFGNGLRIDSVPGYKEIILQGSDSLVTLFDSTVGTIKSWPWSKDFVPHNTIIDNMMNLEMLFWAARNGRPAYYDLAVSHATVTMNNHIRPDSSTYHVAVYDTTDGSLIHGKTHQGYADSSMWARGQAWGIYGFTMCYRETQKTEFLKTAKALADKFISELPSDYIPYWDFDDPNIPNVPRDASAAAIAASAFIELATFEQGNIYNNKYYVTAQKILQQLCSDNYLINSKNNAVLDHSTGHLPGNSEIDLPIIYADYYFIEALLREKSIRKSTKAHN